jgi:hypothetical protein
LRYETLQLSFLLRSVYDLLPSPTNLKLYKLPEDPNCPLYGNAGSLRHIMSDVIPLCLGDDTGGATTKFFVKWRISWRKRGRKIDR